MTRMELDAHIGLLEHRFNAANDYDRQRLEPEVTRIVRTLKEQHRSLPQSLQRIKTRLEQDAFEDMFDNMPI